MPNEADVGTSMVVAAKKAGVRRFVVSSVIDPFIRMLVNHDAKAPVGEAIIESGMEFALRVALLQRREASLAAGGFNPCVGNLVISINANGRQVADQRGPARVRRDTRFRRERPRTERPCTLTDEFAARPRS